jgi:hypothetical protein
MFRVCTGAFVCLLLGYPASTLQAQFAPIKIRVKYICPKEGRSWRSSNGGEKHYCWDGKHYSKSTGGVPAFILDYWEEKERESARFSEEMAQRRSEIPRAGSARSGHAIGRSSDVPIERSDRPVQAPLSRERFQGLEPGMTRAAVIERLGEPHGLIANLGTSGDEESLTYVVEGGDLASVRLKEGKLLKVTLP